METIHEEPNQEPNAKLMNYFRRNAIVLYILTNCPNGQCSTNYTLSLVHTIELMRKLNIRLYIEYTMNEKTSIRAKNNLIAKAMSNKDMTHMIFIDSQVSWNPWDIIKLVVSEKDVIGGACPIGKYEWSVLTGNTDDRNMIKDYMKKRDNSHINNVSDELMLTSILTSYDLNISDSHLEVENNICKINHIGSNFLLIRRQAIMRLFEKYPDKKYMDTTGYLQNDEVNYSYALFDCEIKNGHFFKEDRVFCERWKQLGSSVYLDISISLKLQDPEEFCGSFILALL